MKKLLIFLLSFISLSYGALANYNSLTCPGLYQDAYYNLNELVERFNGKDLSETGFALEVVELTRYVRSGKYICRNLVSSNDRACMDLHEKRYERLRNEISLVAVLQGNQTEISEEVLEYLNTSFLFEFEKVRCEGLF